MFWAVWNHSRVQTVLQTNVFGGWNVAKCFQMDGTRAKLQAIPLAVWRRSRADHVTKNAFGSSSVSRCFRMPWDVLCKASQDVLKRFKMFSNVLKVSQDSLRCLWLSQEFSRCLEMSQDVVRSLMMSWDVLGCFKMPWDFSLASLSVSKWLERYII